MESNKSKSEDGGTTTIVVVITSSSNNGAEAKYQINPIFTLPPKNNSWPKLKSTLMRNVMLKSKKKKMMMMIMMSMPTPGHPRLSPNV
jgi:hypothetical protein